MPRAVYALALAAFVIGTTEFVVVGLLPSLAGALTVGVPTAGLLVTGYAAGVAIGGPLLAVATRRLSPRTALVALMAMFAAGHLVMAMSPDFATLLAARLVTASAHGAFFGLGSIVAGTVVEPARRGRAIAVMFTGLSVATVIGVPGGTLLGQHLGWRAPFAAVAILAAVTAAALHRWLPDSVAAQSKPSPASPATPVPVPALAAALATTVLGWGAMFVPYTFLAAYLEQVTGYGSGAVTALLLLFGVAAAAGGLLGGRANDRLPRAVLPAGLALLASVLVLVWLAGPSRPAMALLLAGWGVAGFALVPALQARVVAIAGPAGAMASTLNIAAFNVGIAAGSALGGLLAQAGHLRVTPAIGAAVVLAAVLPARLARRAPNPPRHSSDVSSAVIEL